MSEMGGGGVTHPDQWGRDALWWSLPCACLHPLAGGLSLVVMYCDLVLVLSEGAEGGVSVQILQVLPTVHQLGTSYTYAGRG